MASVNPPGDAQRAESDPDLVLASAGAVALVGPHGDCPTQPEACAFRYAVLHLPDGTVFAGYLWERG